MSKIVTLVSLEYTKNGSRAEGVPGTIIDTKGTNLKDADVKKLVDDGNAREPTEAELALYDRQNPEKVVAEEIVENQKANNGEGNKPVKQQTEPTEPNGPGGASGETENGNGTVATDVNSVGAGEQGQQDTSSQGEGAASTTKTEKASTAKNKRKADDLA